jgi:hypothetical protein
MKGQKVCIRKIPESFSICCDGCGAVAADLKSKSIPAGWGKFDFHMVGRDAAGHAVGGHKYDYDLCEVCALRVNEFVKTIRGMGD